MIRTAAQPFRIPLVGAAMLAALVAIAVSSCSRKDARSRESSDFEIDQEWERGPVTLRLKVDREEITIAERITLLIEVDAGEDTEVELPRFGEKLEEFGIKDYHSPQPRIIADGRVRTARSYTLEPFLSGEYKIPPMKIAFREKEDQEAPPHEIESEAITINVTSLLPEDIKELKIADLIAPLSLPRPPRRWLLPAVLAAAAAAAVSAAVALYLRRRRSAEAVALARPAHEIAYEQLAALLELDLIGQGRVKEFYNGVSSVLRHYIEKRFALRAPEMTTEEFLVGIGNSPLLNGAHNALLRQFLMHCDLVKFAEFAPTTNDIQKTFDSCKNFIETTKSPGPALETAAI